MPRTTKDGKSFDQTKYVNEWSKDNMKTIGSRYKKEFVEEFKEALKVLGLKQSDVIRQMAEEIIEKAKNN